MAHLDVNLAAVAGIAEPHQSTAAAILRGFQQGLFTAADTERMIDRVRALTIRPAGPDRTVAVRTP